MFFAHQILNNKQACEHTGACTVGFEEVWLWPWWWFRRGSQAAGCLWPI